MTDIKVGDWIKYRWLLLNGQDFQELERVGEVTHLTGEGHPVSDRGFVLPRNILEVRSPAPEPCVWRDIATAPKDGTLVLLWSALLDETRLGWWDSACGWRDRIIGYRVESPTHWCAIPPRPEGEEPR